MFFGPALLITVHMHVLKIHSPEPDVLARPQHVPLSHSLPSQGAAAQRVSAVVSLARDPAGPGPRRLSVLAATCCSDS